MIVAAALQGSVVSAQSYAKQDPLPTVSLRRAIEQEVARLQTGPQPPPPPRPGDIFPTLPSGRLRCSKLKGLGIGAAVGAGVGMATGAIAGNPRDIGGRRFPALVFGIVGASVGALTGLAYCGG